MAGGDAVFGEWSLNAEPELVRAVVALVDVEGVVLVEHQRDVAGVDRATEELDAVVGVGEDLHVVDLRAVADTAEGEAVDFAARGVDVASVADDHVADRAAVVGRIIAAVFDHVGPTVRIEVSGSRRLEAFDPVFLRAVRNTADGDRGIAKDHHAAPASVGRGCRRFGDESVTVDIGLGFKLQFVGGGEDDRLLGGAGRFDLRAANDHQRAELIVVERRCALVVEG